MSLRPRRPRRRWCRGRMTLITNRPRELKVVWHEPDNMGTPTSPVMTCNTRRPPIASFLMARQNLQVRATNHRYDRRIWKRTSPTTCGCEEERGGRHWTERSGHGPSWEWGRPTRMATWTAELRRKSGRRMRGRLRGAWMRTRLRGRTSAPGDGECGRRRPRP